MAKGFHEVRGLRSVPSVGGTRNSAPARGEGCMHRRVRSPAAPAILPPLLRDSTLPEGERGPRNQECGPVWHRDGGGGNARGRDVEVGLPKLAPERRSCEAGWDWRLKRLFL